MAFMNGIVIVWVWVSMGAVTIIQKWLYTKPIYLSQLIYHRGSNLGYPRPAIPSVQHGFFVLVLIVPFPWCFANIKQSNRGYIWQYKSKCIFCKLHHDSEIVQVCSLGKKKESCLVVLQWSKKIGSVGRIFLIFLPFIWPCGSKRGKAS